MRRFSFHCDFCATLQGWLYLIVRPAIGVSGLWAPSPKTSRTIAAGDAAGMERGLERMSKHHAPDPQSCRGRMRRQLRNGRLGVMHNPAGVAAA